MRTVVLFFSVFLLVLAGCSSSPSEVIIIKQESGGAPVVASTNYNLPMVMKPGINEYVGNLITGTLTTLASAAGRINIAPFIPTYDFSVDQFGVSVSTLINPSTARVVIFASDANGRPTTHLYTSGTMDCSTTGTKVVASAFDFKANTLYWVGTWTSSTQALRVGQAYTSAPLSWTSAATPAREHVLRRVLAYSAVNNATDWVYATSQHTGANAPLILMRVSA